MRKLYRNKSGLSTVISTILMIMVVMVGMSVIFSYVVFYSDSYKAGIGSSVLESLTIEDVWFNYSSSQIKVDVFNSGTTANLGTNVNFQVANIYVDGVALTNAQGDKSSNVGTISFNEITVDAGQHVEFTGQSPQILTSGLHELKVVTERGSNFNTQFDVP